MTFDQEFFDKTSEPIIECVKQASEEIIKIYESDEFEASDKDDGSPLTAADRASNEIILENLSKIPPSIPIISEENFNIKLLNDLPSMYWLVDPLDGTKEFINKTDEFTVNIALIENGKTVYGVVGEPIQDKHWIGSNLQISEKDNDSLFNEEKQAKNIGINSVPCFIFNKELVVSGAQPTKNFNQIIVKVNKFILRTNFNFSYYVFFRFKCNSN